MKIARYKLKFDLFERRYLIYEAALNLTYSMITSQTANEDLIKFYSDYKKARWLFNEDISVYLEDKIYKTGRKLSHLSRAIHSTTAKEFQTEDDRNSIKDNCQKQEQLIQSLCEVYYELDEEFAPFLELKH